MNLLSWCCSLKNITPKSDYCVVFALLIKFYFTFSCGFTCIVFYTQCNIATVKCRKTTFFALTRTYRSLCVMVVLNADSYQTLVGEITTARITKKPSLKTRLFCFVSLEYITVYLSVLLIMLGVMCSIYMNILVLLNGQNVSI